MKLPYAILLTIGILIVTLPFRLMHFPIMILIVIGTAVWAMIDSKKIELKKYHSGFISTDPIWVFVGFLLIWVLAFPWYLHMRYQVKNGLATLKNRY